MRFALDFDDTFTASPDLWANFIADARYDGHSVIIVTARRDTPENVEEVDRYLEMHLSIHPPPVFFTSLQSKLDFVKKAGIKVDVWIDDDPTSLVNGH